jgi:hypothetical protein
MQFPYTSVGPGIFRPIVPLLLRGPASTLLSDGLLDSGADRTLLSPRVARGLGIDVAALPIAVSIKSATGHKVPCKFTRMTVELIRGSERIGWVAEMVIPVTGVDQSHWGFKGFLEYFRSEFDGPNRMITLTPGSNLPPVPPTP